jgi:hypothetical protein
MGWRSRIALGRSGRRGWRRASLRDHFLALVAMSAAFDDERAWQLVRIDPHGQVLELSGEASVAACCDGPPVTVYGQLAS